MTVILILDQGALELAKSLKSNLGEARIHGLANRVEGVDETFSETASHLKALFQSGQAIIGICATGILVRSLAPGRRLLVLGRDGDTPGALATLLTEKGYGPSLMTVLAHMGGEAESRLDGRARDWPHGRAPDLGLVAVECRAEPGARVLARVPGLPDDVYEHDGLITKREVRAVALARLMPLPGQTLWDVGAGSGAVAIEWLRAEPQSHAVAIERDPGRAAAIARNAGNLGAPTLEIVEGRAPDVFGGLEGAPDAVFVGGGVSQPGLLEACRERLAPGGRLVANAVTIEAQQRLFAFRNDFGGELTKLSVARAGAVGRMEAFRPFMEVTQLAYPKDGD